MPTLLTHKTAGRDYEMLERFEAGIELLGTEVKSLRAGHGILTGAHVIVRPSTSLRAGGGEVYVVGMQVPPWQIVNAGADYDSQRTRRLLLTHTEIATLSGLEARKGLTVIPLSVFTKGRKIKLGIAVVKSKKKYDKREDIKKREDERAMRRVGKDKMHDL